MTFAKTRAFRGVVLEEGATWVTYLPPVRPFAVNSLREHNYSAGCFCREPTIHGPGLGWPDPLAGIRGCSSQVSLTIAVASIPGNSVPCDPRTASLPVAPPRQKAACSTGEDYVEREETRQLSKLHAFTDSRPFFFFFFNPNSKRDFFHSSGTFSPHPISLFCVFLSSLSLIYQPTWCVIVLDQFTLVGNPRLPLTQPDTLSHRVRLETKPMQGRGNRPTGAP